MGIAAYKGKAIVKKEPSVKEKSTFFKLFSSCKDKSTTIDEEIELLDEASLRHVPSHE